MQSPKPPLYRKLNTTAHAVAHRHGGAYREERQARRRSASDAVRESMQGHARRGRDYTPLFRFLLARVGGCRDAIHAEAVARLDTPEPIFWLVALHESRRRPYVRIGEATYYSGLYVDAAGRLQRVDPALGPSSLRPQCACCTHTFNGVPFTRAFVPPEGDA